MEDWRKSCKERKWRTRTKAFPVSIYDMACCSLSINFCAYSASCCCIIVETFPSLIIICSFLSRFCTSSSSSRCSAKASWVSLEISALSSDGLDMAITAYHPWRDLIYHFFGTDLLRSIFNLFLTVSLENLSSSCCNNASRISSLSVADQRILRYRAVPLIS